MQVRQPHALSALGVEIIGRQPLLERRFSLWPFVIEHGVPRGVAAAPFLNHVLAKGSFERESEADRSPPGWSIQRVALPFIAPIAEILEDVASHQIHRL